LVGPSRRSVDRAFTNQPKNCMFCCSLVIKFCWFAWKNTPPKWDGVSLSSNKFFVWFLSEFLNQFKKNLK
jgi:hypothetical protein